MASADLERLPERFVTINDDDLEALRDTTSSINSNKSMQYSVRILYDFCKERSLNLEAISKGWLNLLLNNFYASVQTKENEFYSKKSMISICYGIQKHCERCCKFDIINEPWHGISNNVVCVTSKASDQPAHIRSLIRAFASRLDIPGVLSY